MRINIASTVNIEAHAGGWDEILLGTSPVLLIIGLIYIARSRRPTDDSVGVKQICEKREFEDKN
ncbi:MAG: hypothetical protein ACRCSF_08390 [Mycobacteriaceae bacterium]